MEKCPVAKATSKIMHATLQSGSSLFEMNARALNKFASFLDDIGIEGQETDLHQWLKHHFTIATTEALYVPVNPISEDESMIQKPTYCFLSHQSVFSLTSCSDFESSVGLLFLDIFTSMTCPAGHRAGLAFTTAFKRYYEGQHNVDANAIVQGRYSVLSAGGFTIDDLAL